MPPATAYGSSRARGVHARLLSRVNSIPQPGQGPGVAHHTVASAASYIDMVARNRRVDPLPAGAAGAITTQRVSSNPKPGGKNVKSNQAWKYPGGVILRASGVTINGRYYTDPKESGSGGKESQGNPPTSSEGTPRRKQESNFFITINPNQHYGDGELAQAATARFHKALEHLSQNEVIARTLKFGPKHEHYSNDTAHDVIIPGIDWKASVETGEKKFRMHAHVICYIQHYSQIQFCPKMLRNEFKAAFNEGLPPNDKLRLKFLPYVRVNMLPQSDWTTIMRAYIQKGMV
jgi:hypothetical protein